MNNVGSSLRFIDYVVNKVEFYINPNFEDKPIKIDFDISSNVEFIQDKNNTFLLHLDARIFKDAEKNGYPFSMNINITGIFELESSELENKEKFAELNAVAILFPYLRSLVSTYSSNSNVQPLILPPINVVKYMKSKNTKKD